MSSEEPLGKPITYAIRYSPRARRELIETALRLGEIADPSIAEQWSDGFVEAVSQLATKPRQFPIVPEQNNFKYEVRHLVYRRPGSAVAHRAIYVTEDESDDGPTVTLIHVRHAAARPIGRKTARDVESGEE